MHDTRNGTSVASLNYKPEKYPSHDMEIFRMSELRKRVHPSQLSGSRKYYFYMMLLVTNGTVCQMIDCSPVDCRPGTLIMIRPGQVHHLGNGNDWDGWLILFRSEILPPLRSTFQSTLSKDIRQINSLALTGDNFFTIEHAVRQMSADIRNCTEQLCLNQLLYHQLGALITRLSMLSKQKERTSSEETRDHQRFRQFTHLIEENLGAWHQVNQYAKAMNCSSKSLTRATTAIAGCSAKSYLSDCICLEAKRLLAHTPASVNFISQLLGFDEPTHFVKFFKSCVGLTPVGFRESLEKTGLRR
ncbi:helix-turn-helix domain-containing protein [Pectobacterium punjabense]|uniref:Helix-turn-helix domain-containing protein n=1 Tax=Pectobacterium punjabense TaxID=2108399 RepID=A0ABX6KXR7_9GAMM|nr:AraC family transcriptional regulator [Pectobacterium punjabense]MBS4430645.1 helix-turn-helix domain-containing protein [Pectobacterium punjabense]PTA64062.1 AraC family transcriptional regulator [Pectobacterium punjabense]QJA18863.1 helix-turn-helix domain-containing protein [Pectobacterium punjabense]